MRNRIFYLTVQYEAELAILRLRTESFGKKFQILWEDFRSRTYQKSPLEKKDANQWGRKRMPISGDVHSVQIRSKIRKKTFRSEPD